jgi:hypothetical protein
MKKEFIPYEQALELKELGFDEPCFGRYDGRDENKGKIWYEMPNLGKGWIPVEDVLAPLYQQAFRWFREKYGFTYSIGVTNIGVVHVGTTFLLQDNDSFEEAEIACIKKFIEIVKNK